jgi:hypothetical protein
MRSLRITVAIAAIACAFGAFAAPSFANKEKEKAFFGEFVASKGGQTISPSNPGITKGKEGELDEMYVGPSEERWTWKFECEKLTSAGKVTAEHSETFLTEIQFHKCHASRRLFGNIVENGLPVKFGKGLEMEFHSNGAAALGKTEGEATIKKGTSIAIKIPRSTCEIKIPAQSIPTKFSPEKEYESAEYSSSKEEEKNLKKYPSGFKEELEVEWFLKKLIYDIPAEKGGSCEYLKEPGGTYNPELKVVEYPGYFEGLVEEIQLKQGSIGFTTEKPAEV